MLALVQATHRELKGAYGSPRMVRKLRGRGLPASKEHVERLMRENGIRGTPQAPVQGDDGFEARPAGGAEPACQELRAGRAESGVER